MFLSAKGITESGPVQEVDTAPFDLIDDELAIDSGESVETLPVLTGADGSMLPVVAEYVRLQRNAFNDLLKFIEAFGRVPKSLPKSQPRQVTTPAMFPADLLSRPIENIQVGDARLGLPPGCCKILNDAGIVSVAMLIQHITEQTLVKIPRIGKAKAAVITETIRAFEAAKRSHEQTPY